MVLAPDLVTKIEISNHTTTYFNARVIVRLNGKDYDISHVTAAHDGVIGDNIVLHATPLEV